MSQRKQTQIKLFCLLMKSFKQYIQEDGGMGAGAISVPGPTNKTGAQSSTDPISATAVNPKKKRTPVLMGVRRSTPQM
jgi:hypothetical protein